MPWAKVDDQFTDHVKVVSLSLAAKGLWLCGLVYAARRSTDGFIPASVPIREGAGEDVAPLIDELVRADLWVRCDGGYRIHDYLEYNPSKAEIDAMRDSKSEAGAKGAAKRWGGKSMAEPMAPAIAEPIANEWQNDAPIPVPIPVTPFPVTQEPETHTERGAKRATRTKDEPPKRPTRLPEDWTPPEAMRVDALAAGMTAAEYDREFTKFRNHFLAGTATKIRWDLTWHNWLLRAPELNRGRSPTQLRTSNRVTPDDLDRFAEELKRETGLA